MAITYRDFAEVATGSGAITYSGLAIGPAASDRLVVVGVSQRLNSISSMTIGGVTATEVVSQVSDRFNFSAALYTAVVPTGTTADVVVTVSGTVRWQSVGVWTGDGLTLSASASTASASTSLSTVDGGDHVAVVSHAGTSGAMSWSGVTASWTQATDAADADDWSQGGAAVSSGTSVTISLSGSSGAAIALACASFSVSASGAPAVNAQNNNMRSIRMSP